MLGSQNSPVGAREKGHVKRALKWRGSLSETQMNVQGKINLPLPARMLGQMKMGVLLWVRRFTERLPI